MTATYEKIATSTSSGGSTITLSSIPSTYTDLVLIFSGDTGGGITSLQFNGDTGSNYHSVMWWGTGSGPVVSRYSTAYTFVIPGSGGQVFLQKIQIMDYANTTTYKSCVSRVDGATASTTTSCQLWKSTSAINSISLVNSGTYNSYEITLYGIKKE